MIGQQGTGSLHVFHSLVLSSALLAKIHNRSDKFCCHHDLGFYHRLFHIFDRGRIRKIGRIRQIHHFTVCLMHFIDNTRCGCYQIQVVFSLQTLLDDLQMQQSEESAAETKSKSDRCLRFILQRRII